MGPVTYWLPNDMPPGTRFVVQLRFFWVLPSVASHQRLNRHIIFKEAEQEGEMKCGHIPLCPPP